MQPDHVSPSGGRAAGRSPRFCRLALWAMLGGGLAAMLPAASAGSTPTANSAPTTSSGPTASSAPAGSARAVLAARTLRMGALTLTSCGRASTYCGHLERALDPESAIAGSVAVYFEFYRHSSAGTSRGTLVATEGGPGYPATLSRDEYLDLFAPLRSDYDVLIMDNRGTGQSGAIDCHTLQTAEAWTVELVAACGESLGERSALYGAPYATDDLAAILRALQVGKIDLYGDSYGTYFEQVFVTRHPELIESVVLDGAYPLSGADYPWYPSYAPAMRDKFNLSCARSAECAALPGSSLEHIQPALAALRAAPFAASGFDVDGTRREFTANASKLAIVMFGAAPAATSVAETDAAARAYVAGDRAPLLRLMAETSAAVDSRDASEDPTQWSAGLSAAAMCSDPPQIFDMRLTADARRADRDRVLEERRREHPDTYAPFSIDEFRGMPLDYSFLDLCVGWPVAPARHPAAQVGIDAVYPDVPALVISGELDDITTPADGAAVAAAFPHGVQVRIANSFHVNALPHARSACAAGIVRHFLATHAVGRSDCATAVPPVRLVPAFALHYSELAPAIAMRGNAADEASLRRVAAALLTAGDALARAKLNSSGQGVGLRGGTFEVRQRGAAMQLTLHGVRWVEDLAVSGTLLRVAGRNGRVRARLTLDASPSPVERWPSTSHQVESSQSADPGSDNGDRRHASRFGASRDTLQLSWVDGIAPSDVRIEGHVGVSAVRAHRPAP